MKTEFQKNFSSLLKCPGTAFVVGTVCGFAVGLLMLPVVKGVVIGSYNGNIRDEHKERDHILASPKTKKLERIEENENE